MALQPGARLGPYEVLSPLGAGGMGEVYRARDPRLSRDIALKVLPPDLASEENLARFEREARAASALSHPNILVVHDVGSADGVAYIAMELLEGTTLRDVLSSAPLNVRRLLDIGGQIAEGLAAAHEKGIVHRDLKPENVFVTPDGHVKILDFGLAKPVPLPASESGTTVAPQARSTGAGIVLGTVAYMAPEQAAGRPIGKQADQFSLGSVLYEMVTGRQPFTRPTTAETMAAIIREEPEPLATAAPSTPAPLVWLVERLLAKEPSGRYDSTRDLARDLKSLRDHLSARTAPSPATTAARPRVLRSVLPIAGGLALLLLGVFVGRRTAPPPPQPPRLKYITSSGRDGSPAISPDGRLCAFVSVRDGTPRIWLKQLSGGSEIALTTGSDAAPRFTPDSTSLFFTRLDASGPALYRVSALGGPPQRVLVGATEADVSPDGTRIAFIRSDAAEGGRTQELWVAATDGSGERLVDTARISQLRSPRWSPDGTWVATAGGQVNIGSPWTIILVNPATGEKRSLQPAAGLGELSNIAWTGDSRALVYGRREQAIVPASPGAYYLQDVRSGAVRTIAYSLGVGVGLDIAGRGRLVVESLSIPTNLLEVPLAGTATPRRWLTQGSHVNFQPLVSGDGERVVFTSNREGNSDVWELTLSTSAVRRLTDHPASDADVFLSRDGKTLLWASTRTGHFEIWGAEGDGSAPHRISDDGADAENPSLSPDGSTIVYVSFNESKRGIWTIRPDGTNAKPLARGILPEFSPDGAWVSFVRQGASPSIQVVRLADGASVFSIPNVPAGRGFIYGRHRWMPDGRHIAFLGGDGPDTALFVQDVVPGKDTAATRRKLVDFEPDMELHSFGIAPDVSFAVVAVRQATANLLEIDGLPPDVAPAVPRR